MTAASDYPALERREIERDMIAILRTVIRWLFPSEKQVLRWGHLLFPPGKEAERINLLLWAFPVLLLGIAALAFT